MLLFILLSLLVGSAAAVACIFLGLSGERPGHQQQQLYVFWLMLFLLLFLFVGMPEVLVVFAK
jgi:hypothetical protein